MITTDFHNPHPDDEVAQKKKRLDQQARQLNQNAHDMAANVNEMYGLSRNIVQAQLKERPYAVIGAAAGAGFVLGRGLPVWMTQLIVKTGARVAIGAVVGALIKEEA